MTGAGRPQVTVVGAGIIGLWQAFELARRGFPVTLREGVSATSTGAASRFAGAMLAPFCEAEAAPAMVKVLGRRGLALWREHYCGTAQRGTLVVAAPALAELVADHLEHGATLPEIFRSATL
jgi:glycine oxidase